MSRLPFLTFIAAALLSTGAIAQDAPSLQSQMSAEQFHAAGLDKLSPAELQSLQQWLANHKLQPSPAKKKAEAIEHFGQETMKPAPDAPKSINVHIVGEFNGWQKGDVFTLDNGQRWRVDEGSLVVRPRSNPQVTIKRGMLGGYYLKVDGYNSVANVVRLR